MSEIKEQDNLLNSDIKIYKEPFTHWTMKNMFEKSFYEELKTDFPKVNDFNLNNEVMGGRFELDYNDSKFLENN